jgi:hypothetical protein
MRKLKRSYEINNYLDFSVILLVRYTASGTLSYRQNPIGIKGEIVVLVLVLVFEIGSVRK